MPATRSKKAGTERQKAGRVVECSTNTIGTPFVLNVERGMNKTANGGMA